MKILPEHSYHN